MGTLYVNTDGSNGDGSIGSPFNNLRAAIDALPETFTAAWDIYWVGATADTTPIPESSLTFATTAANRLTVHGEGMGPGGSYDASKARLEITNGDGWYNNGPAHITLKDMQIKLTLTSSVTITAFRLSTANVTPTDMDQRYENCLAYLVMSGGTGNMSGFNDSNPGHAGTCKRINCVVISNATTSDGTQGFVSDGTAWAISNLTNYNCSTHKVGYEYLDAQICVNCLASAPGGGDGTGFISTGSSGHSHNASSDSSALGTSSRTNQTFSFVNVGSYDLRLTPTDAGAKGFGVDDPASGLYSDDANGVTRTSPWSIGAFEPVAPTAALTGTATASIVETDIVAGGKTVILTLTNDTYVPAAGTPAYNAATTKGTTAADSAGGGGGLSGNGALTCTFPSGYTPTAGHFAVMIVYCDQGSGSTPTNWSAVTGSPFGAGTPKLCVFYKVLAGGEGSPVTTISGSTGTLSSCANMVIYTGIGSIGAVGTAANGTGTPMTANALTTTKDGSICIFCCGRGDNESSSGQTFGGSATGVAERLDGGTAAGDDSQVSMADKTITTSGSSSGAGSSTTSITDPWVGVMIELVSSTPFADGRAAMRSGGDSAQSEAGGWDAKVKPNIPLGNIVRTSGTICTITLQAQADYNITAQETITWTIPGSILSGGSAIVASPTFTIDPVSGGTISPGVVTSSYTANAPRVVKTTTAAVSTHSYTTIAPKASAMVRPTVLTHTYTGRVASIGASTLISPSLITHSYAASAPNLIQPVAAIATTHSYQGRAPQVKASVRGPLITHSYVMRTPQVRVRVGPATAVHTYTGRVPSVQTVLSYIASSHTYNNLVPALRVKVQPVQTTHSYVGRAPKLSPMVRPPVRTHAYTAALPQVKARVQPAVVSHSYLARAIQTLVQGVFVPVVVHTYTTELPQGLSQIAPGSVDHTYTPAAPQVRALVTAGLVTHAYTAALPQVKSLIQSGVVTHTYTGLATALGAHVFAEAATHIYTGQEPQMKAMVSPPAARHRYSPMTPWAIEIKAYWLGYPPA